MDSKMQCRGMQYAVGKEFSVDGDIECCGNGLHACERPLDVFGYYAPGTGARYFRVEQSGDMARDGSDSKVASRKMRVDAEIGIPGLAKAHIEYVKAHTTTEHTDPECATAGDSGAATAGYYGAATSRGSALARRQRAPQPRWKRKRSWHRQRGRPITHADLRRPAWGDGGGAGYDARRRCDPRMRRDRAEPASANGNRRESSAADVSDARLW